MKTRTLRLLAHVRVDGPDVVIKKGCGCGRGGGEVQIASEQPDTEEVDEEGCYASSLAVMIIQGAPMG